MSPRANQKDANRRRGRLVPVLGLLLLLALSGTSGCADSRKQMGKWWEKSVRGWNNRQLIVTSHPPRADVFVDDVYQGKTPLRLEFKASVKDMLKGFAVSVRKEGYLPITRKVPFRAGRVTFKLIRRRK